MKVDFLSWAGLTSASAAVGMVGMVWGWWRKLGPPSTDEGAPDLQDTKPRVKPSAGLFVECMHLWSDTSVRVWILAIRVPM